MREFDSYISVFAYSDLCSMLGIMWLPSAVTTEKYILLLHFVCSRIYAYFNYLWFSMRC